MARLLEHPRFDPAAPNSVRAVLGGLAGNTPVFHAADGSGMVRRAAAAGADDVGAGRQGGSGRGLIHGETEDGDIQAAVHGAEILRARGAEQSQN